MDVASHSNKYDTILNTIYFGAVLETLESENQIEMVRNKERSKRHELCETAKERELEKSKRKDERDLCNCESNAG